MDRKLFQNSVYNVLYRLINILFPLITSMYCGRILMPEGVGLVTYAQTIVMYFVTFAALGLPNYGTKKIGTVQKDALSRSRVFSELFIINLISSLALSVLFIFSVYVTGWLGHIPLIGIMGTLLYTNGFAIDWFYQGIENYRFISTRNVAVKIVSLICVFLFVRTSEDVGNYAWIVCFSTIGSNLLNVLWLRKYTRVTLKNLHITRHFRPLLVLLASACATEIYTMLDTTMIGHFRTAEDVGYYSNAVKTVRIAYTFVTAICAVYLPRMSFYREEKNREKFETMASSSLRISLLLSVPCFLGVFLLSDHLMPLLFGEAFVPAAKALKVLAVLIVVFSISYSAGHCVLIALDMEDKTLMAAVTGAVVNFCINYILIPRTGFTGAAVASVISEILVMLVLCFWSVRKVHFRIGKRYIAGIVTAGLIMAVCVRLLLFVCHRHLLSVLLCTVSGAIVYFGVLLIWKNETVMIVLNMIRKRTGRP